MPFALCAGVVPYEDEMGNPGFAALAGALAVRSRAASAAMKMMIAVHAMRRVPVRILCMGYSVSVRGCMSNSRSGRMAA